MGFNKFWLALILVFVLGFFVWWCWLQPEAVAECPDHGRLEVDDAQGGSTTITNVKLAGLLTFIPEFNDCQKLIEPAVSGKPLKFGPLVAIWVSENLERLPDSLRLLNLNNAWPRPTDSSWVVVDSEGLGVTQQPPNSAALRALPFAVIHAWKEGYPALNIPRGWSCLYLYPSPSGVGYGAQLVKVGENSACYDPTTVARLRGVPLNVSVEVVNGLTESDYPAVGRWDTDASTGEVYIGMKCGAAWCEVSPPSPHVTSARYGEAAAAGATALTAAQRIQQRVLAVKGWYDEQRVAVKSPSGGLEPAAFRAIVVPDAGLDELTFHPGIWERVGWAALETSSTEYEDHLNVVAGTLPPSGSPQGGTEFWLCKGDACEFPAGTKPNCTVDPAEGPWYSRAVAVVTQKTKYDCVVRHDHPTVPKVWGSARWRWDYKDEKLWFRCDAGCCSGQ